MENNKELFAKAKAAETPEALLTLAKENGMEMTDESAAAYFDRLNPKTGELSDSELDNVSGGCGGGYDAGRLPQGRRKIDRFRRLFMRVLGMQTLRSACDEIFRRYFQVRSMRKAAELQ